MSIDPRLRERRREVAEDHATRNLRRLLRFLVWLAALGTVIWLLSSPWLSVAEVKVAGVVASEADAILTAHDVVPGTPMILVRADRVEEVLLTDPWIVSAEVDRRWPDQVVVRITERVPAAWVETSGGWTRRAVDGVALPSSDQPDNTLGWVRLPTVSEGEAQSSELVTGSIEFLTALPAYFAPQVAVTLEAGELWAVVDEYRVRLGRPREMAEKALALMTLLREDIPAGSTLILVAPSHPAVSTP